jgi:hypothetical protein
VNGVDLAGCCSAGPVLYPHFSRRLDALKGLPEGRGFSPAESAALRPQLVPCPSQSRRRGTARGTGHRINQEGLVTAGLKPRPSRPLVRNAP